MEDILYRRLISKLADINLLKWKEILQFDFDSSRLRNNIYIKIISEETFLKWKIENVSNPNDF